MPLYEEEKKKVLLKGGDVFSIDGIKVEYLFTGDTFWFGAHGGYSFISTLAEDNRQALRALGYLSVKGELT